MRLCCTAAEGGLLQFGCKAGSVLRVCLLVLCLVHIEAEPLFAVPATKWLVAKERFHCPQQVLHQGRDLIFLLCQQRLDPVALLRPLEACWAVFIDNRQPCNAHRSRNGEQLSVDELEECDTQQNVKRNLLKAECGEEWQVNGE